MTDLERHLDELGVIPRPSARQEPQPIPPRPDQIQARGVWYPDGNIPF